MLPEPIGYKYFYINENWEYIEITKKEYEEGKKVKILIRNNKTDKHYKIEMGGKVKVGDKIMRLNEHEYLYNGKFEYCEVVKIFEPKEEKKVKSKPKMSHEKFKKLEYLDVKVVKVEQPIPEKPGMYCRIGSRVYKVHERKGKNPYLKEFKKNKGNWVNGENIDAIRFPAYCSYVINGKIYKGQINKAKYESVYSLYWIGGQSKYSNWVDSAGSLKPLIDNYDIHILKARIILFDETTESGQVESG